jgi:hypothetical protein
LHFFFKIFYARFLPALSKQSPKGCHFTHIL